MIDLGYPGCSDTTGLGFVEHLGATCNGHMRPCQDSFQTQWLQERAVFHPILRAFENSLEFGKTENGPFTPHSFSWSPFFNTGGTSLLQAWKKGMPFTAVVFFF